MKIGTYINWDHSNLEDVDDLVYYTIPIQDPDLAVSHATFFESTMLSFPFIPNNHDSRSDWWTFYNSHFIPCFYHDV